MGLAPLAVLSGCISVPVKPPPLQTVELAGRTVEYRDYRKGNVCDAEPQWLIEQLRSMNRLLVEWSKGAEIEEGAAPTPAQKALIAEGAKVLPPVLDAYGPTLDRIDGCFGGFGGHLKEAPREGHEAVALARAQLKTAPETLERIAAAERLEAWRRSWPERRDQARATWCPAGAAAATSREIFFAYADEAGTTRWLFCDGAEVERPAASGSLSLATPPTPVVPARGKRKLAPPPPPKTYLEAAASYPAKEVERAPR